jgi:MFS family permease
LTFSVFMCKHSFANIYLPLMRLAYQGDGTVVKPRNGSFLRLWLATALSNIADGVMLLGLALLAVQLTRSPALVSLVSAAATLPWLLLALLAGALADRWDRRRIMLMASWSRAIVFAVVAVAAAFDQLTLPVLYGVALAFGIAEVFSDISAQSMLPMVVAHDRLDSANGRLVATQTVGNNFLGAPLAGVLVSVSAAAALGAPALLYGAAALVLLRMRGEFMALTPSTASLRSDIAYGLRYLAGHRIIRALAVISGTFNLANAAYFAVFVLYAVGPTSAIGLTESGYSLLFALLAAGAILGSVVVEQLSRLVGNARLLIAALTANCLLLLIPVLAPTLPAVAVAVVLLGFTNAMTNVLSVSMRQRLVPEHLLGRVNATVRFVGMGAVPLGAVLGGLIGDVISLPAVFYAAVAVCLLGLVLTTHAVLSPPSGNE